MTKRPWVTPQEVKDYSEDPSVQNRKDARLAVDITRAEQYVISATHNTFEDYETIPPEIRTAVILLAEAYAHNAVIATKELKSETFDDYSYTAESSSISLADLDLAALLDKYTLAEPKNGVSLRMRRL